MSYLKLFKKESSLPNSNSAIRTDIQFLRTIAVTAVVLNHLFPAKLTGGFLGVDIFFVISGFLITGHLLREWHSSSQINLVAFYIRRAKRLLPAALFVAFVSLLLVVLLLPAGRWAANAWEIFAAAAYFQNWALYFAETDYFAQQQAYTLVQHYWSLSVEEQFYLVWPVVLLVIFSVGTFWLGKKGKQEFSLRSLCALFGFLLLGLFMFAQWLITVNPQGAYFSTFARAWEFMLGALCVPLSMWLQQKSALRHKSIIAVTQLAAYALILFAMVKQTSEDQIPGWGSLSAVGSAAAIIVLGPVTLLPVLRFLIEHPIAQYLAQRSYSIYLWHWPLIVIAPFVVNSQLRIEHKIVIVLLTLFAAEITYRYIENSVRKKSLATVAPWRILLAVVVSISLTAACSVTVKYAGAAKLENDLLRAQDSASRTTANTTGVICLGAEAAANAAECETELYAPAVMTDIATQAPWEGFDSACVAVQNLLAGAQSHYICDYSDGDETGVEIVLAGNSHAEHFMHAFTEMAKVNRWKLNFSSVPGCVPVLFDPAEISEAQANGDCFIYTSSLREYMVNAQPKFLFLASAAESQAGYLGHLEPEVREKYIQETYEKFTASGTRLTVLRDTPYGGEQLGPACLEIRGSEYAGCVNAATAAVLPDYLAQQAEQLQQNSDTIRVLEMTDLFCYNEECYGVIGTVPVYYDNDHLSRAFSRSLGPELSRRVAKTWNLELRIPELSKNLFVK